MKGQEKNIEVLNSLLSDELTNALCILKCAKTGVTKNFINRS